MSHQISIRNLFVIVFIIIIGLTLAFTLTSLAKAGSLAIQLNNTVQPGNNHPAPSSPSNPTVSQVQAPNPAPIVYYVSKNGNGSDGLNWTNAYTDPQIALSTAVSGDEIWVATGIYTPGIKQTYSFILKPGVAVYGGFAATETSRTQRNWNKNLTVLSGDISGDDITDNSRIMTDTDNLVGNNNYHVVYAIGVFSDTVLDGFSITSGKADGGTNFYKVGGGIFCNGTGINGNCSPTLENLNLSGNLAAEKGGGIYNNAAFSGTTSPNMTNVSFLYNKSLDKGGAIYNDGDQGSISLILEDVNFFNNSADNSGGAVYNFCDGGTISSDLKNIVIAGNSAAVAGGAIYNLNNNGAFSSTLKNIAFSGNSVNIAGGAIYNNGSISSTLSNITFSGNRADLAGGALYNNNAGNIEIRNTIVWNNLDKSRLGTVDANIQNSGNSTTTLKNSLVQGTGGSSSWISDTSYVNEGGNIDEDPLFIDPLSPSEAPTTAGNLRLQENSPAIDSGGNMYIVGVPFDLDGNKRIVDGNSHGSPTVDIGAFEFQINYKFGVYIPVTYH